MPATITDRLQGITTSVAVKAPCRVATTAAISLTSAPATIDGIALVASDRVLVKDQASAVANGIYVFSAASQPLTRSLDFDGSLDVVGGTLLFVQAGAVSGNIAFRIIGDDSAPVVIGTDDIEFEAAFADVVAAGEAATAAAADAEGFANDAEASAVAAAASATSIAAVNQWFVAADGDTGDGTRSDPWSLAWAGSLSNTDRQDGDIIWVLDSGGTYPANEVFNGIPDAVAQLQVRAYPGHHPEISGAISGITWSLSLDAGEAALNVYVSDQPISATTNNRQVHGFVMTDGGWQSLMADRWGALTPSTPAVSRTSHLYRTDGVFYPGPMIQAASSAIGSTTVPATSAGRAKLRLTNATAAAMQDKPTWQVASVVPDPALLKIFDSNSVGVTIRGNNVTFQGIEINDCWQNFKYDTGSGDVETIIVDGCHSPRMGYTHCRLAAARNPIVRNCITNGCMDEKHWIGFSEVKGAATLGEPIRKVPLLLDEVIDASIYGNRFEQAFDGMLGGHARGVEIGKFGDDLLDEASHWLNANYFVKIIDDATQLYMDDQGLHIHHNYFFGAGPAFDGGGASTASGELRPIIHHNVMDPRTAPIYWQREPDPADVNYAALVLEPVLRHPTPFGGHGLADSGGYFYPIKAYHNTMYFVLDHIRSRFESFGPWFEQDGRGLSTTFKHVIANNLIMSEYDEFGWVARYNYCDQGRSIWDGNLLVRIDNTQSIYRFTFRGGVQVQNGTLTYAAWYAQNSAADFNASKAIWAPGYDTSSRNVIDVTPSDWIDAAGAPLNATAYTGAANLQGLDLPGMFSYQEWVGAKAPL